MTKATAVPVRRHWLERRGSLAVAVVAAWSLLAAIPATSAFIVAGGRAFAHWWAMYVPIVSYYYLWALVSPLVYRLVERCPFDRRHGPRAAVWHLLVFGTFTTGSPFIVHANNWEAWLYGDKAAGFHAMGAFTYTLIVMSCLALKHYRIGLERERQAARMELRSAMLDGQLSEARIDALRSQINPHFLFNALNSIGALIETGHPDRAYGTLERLSALLRRALDPGSQQRIALAEELAFVADYVAIEEVRFGDRLDYRVDLEPGAESLTVPELILQPLVENAVKHAVATSTDRVRIRLRCRLDKEVLELTVQDDGPGFGSGTGPGPRQGANGGNGQGLSNIRQRLSLLYGTRASLAWRSEGGAEFVLRLPAERQAG